MCTMEIASVKGWQWTVLVLVGMWSGVGSGSPAEFAGSVLGALLFGYVFIYVLRSIRSQLNSDSSSAST